MTMKMLRPDAKGRVTLGALAIGVSSFNVTVDRQHRIILEPLVEIPAHEKWLFNNKLALNKVEQGIKDSISGKISKKPTKK